MDSSEFGNPNWTQDFRSEFKRLRGYDPFPYMAAKLGQIVDSPRTTHRFLEDYQRTLGDLMATCYYGRLTELGRPYGLRTHSEAAGFQKPDVDAIRALGCSDIVMVENWSRSNEDRSYIHQFYADQLRNHDAVRNGGSAAHVYGRRIVQSEAFTVMDFANWSHDPCGLKDIGDRAFCNGVNRNVLTFWVHQPEEDVKPGYAWPTVGGNFDRHLTWWPMGKEWTKYLTRCQLLLQSGKPRADICYFQGEWVPAFPPAKWAMDPPMPAGYDCDVMNAEALLTRAEAGTDGSLVLPDGVSYRYLVLYQNGGEMLPKWYYPVVGGDSSLTFDLSLHVPEAGSGKPLAVSLPVLRKMKELVEGGVTLIGPKPDRLIVLAHDSESEAELEALTGALWEDRPAKSGMRSVGKGRVIWGKSLAACAQEDGLHPDVEIVESDATKALPLKTWSGVSSPMAFEWIHRTIDGAEFYFVANLRNAEAEGRFTFRVDGMQPELWDPVRGKIRDAGCFEISGGRCTLPLRFAPRESCFVVFRKPATRTKGSDETNTPLLKTLQELTGPWTVNFDPAWGGPESVVFDELQDWITRTEPGIKHYSGKATYKKTFDIQLPASDLRSPTSLFLDLNRVRNIARVRLNGQDLGVVWTAPWQVEITGVVKPTGNKLEVDVINLWPNRLIGDRELPPAERLTRTNVEDNKFMKPLPSGLLGPVRVLVK
jgi:hypothetical protein